MLSVRAVLRLLLSAAGPNFINDSALAPWAALLLAEEAAGVINGGAAALSWWTFFDVNVARSPGHQHGCLLWVSQVAISFHQPGLEND